MSAQTYRSTFTLPAVQAVMLSDVAKRLGCSQSAVLSVLLSQTLKAVAAGLAANVHEGTVTRRLVGDSAGRTRDQILLALNEGKQFEQAGFDLEDIAL